MTARPTLWQLLANDVGGHDLVHAQYHLLFKRTRKKGPYKLTADEITTSQEIVRRALRKNPKLARRNRDDLAEHFRPLFKLKREVSNRTLWRHIIKPVIKP